MIYPHISDAIKEPKLINLKENLFIARFESMKIYSALSAVRNLLDTGRIKRTDTLIDSSSGIYAYALALACKKHGLKCHIIASKTVDPTLKIQLELMGVIVEPAAYAPNLKMDQQNRVTRIHEILSQRDDVYWMQQYHDDIHYLGYRDIAEVIVKNFNAPKMTIVGGVGSGCSTGAITDELRTLGVDVTLHGIQPFGSVTFNSEHVEDPGIIIAGIGSAIPFNNVRPEYYDYIHWISFNYSSAGTVNLLKDHAVFAGLSTGACYTVAHWCHKTSAAEPCLFFGADMGHRYTEAVFQEQKHARSICELKPKIVTCADEMEMPWSAVKWNRQQSVQSQPLCEVALS